MSRILVVDDDAAAVSGLRTLLELDGYSVTGVESPRVALDLIARESFDAVVTDLEMPGVGGIEIVRAARAARATIPVLVVTGYAESPAAAAAIAVGARRVLPKPLDYDLLAAELVAALAKSSA